MPDQYRYKALKEEPLKSRVRELTGGKAPLVSLEDLPAYYAKMGFTESELNLLEWHVEGEYLGYLKPWVLA